jgi:hypothetical protein
MPPPRLRWHARPRARPDGAGPEGEMLPGRAQRHTQLHRLESLAAHVAQHHPHSDDIALASPNGGRSPRWLRSPTVRATDARPR